MRQELKNLKMVCTDRGVILLGYTVYTTLLLPSMDAKVTWCEWVEQSEAKSSYMLGDALVF